MLDLENEEINLDEQDKKAWQILSKIVASISADAEVNVVSVEQGSTLFEIVKTDPGIMIGKHGHTLDAIQYLVNLLANQKRSLGVYKNYIIDINGYRKRREESLQRYALEKAELAKKRGYTIPLYFMNSIERKLVHMALKNDTGVTTHSEGREPYRRIIIKPFINVDKKEEQQQTQDNY